jgi:glycosyltransferase involved in cell wall biosynthesis/GT2 family glycosyltransferase
VIVPFYGDEAEAVEALTALQALDRSPRDELIFADDTPDRILLPLAEERSLAAVGAPRRGAEAARNEAAEHASNEWLLFMDADCRPGGSLLDDFFDEPVDDRCGVVVGGIVAARGQNGLLPRYARSRQILEQSINIEHPYKPFGAHANLLVRRAAWASVGGFWENVRSGSDTAFCWRIQDAGWSLAYRPQATVEHVHRESLDALLRQMARYGAGRAWLERRYHGAFVARHYPRAFRPPRPLRGLARCVAGILVWTLRGRFERALFKAVDAAAIAGDAGGFFLSNATVGADVERTAPKSELVVLVDSFPQVSETFVIGELRALERLGRPVRVEALARPGRQARGAMRGLAISYLEDDGLMRRLSALAWLSARHPLRCLADLVLRIRWRREEEVLPLRALAPLARRLARLGERHMHAHFAALSALNALRLSRLTGVPYSVTAHAYDIFESPRNLREKLERAAFATTGCEYNREHLRQLVGPEHRDRIHTVLMGVDGERFRRRRPYPGGRTVIAVGRLVEKKGFRYLIEAAARLEQSAPLERLVIVGEGPLRAELEALAERLGLAAKLELVGAREHDEVRARLEEADLLAAPCVVARNGDRDSMPVVVKEALAMELPVVASDEVGLPELLRPAFGRLVPPGDPRALAEAIAELLSLPPEERAAMGRAGRAHVLEHADVHRETAKLAELIPRNARREPGR